MLSPFVMSQGTLQAQCDKITNPSKNKKKYPKQKDW